jgi:hypothetical protein
LREVQAQSPLQGRGDVHEPLVPENDGLCAKPQTKEHLHSVGQVRTSAPYRENLAPHLKHYEVPMEGLAFGKQLQWLDANCNDC